MESCFFGNNLNENKGNSEEIQKKGKEELLNVLENFEEGISSDSLDVDKFDVLGKWENGEFMLNENIIYKNQNGEKYIIVDGIQYYETGNNGYKYMKIFDEYGAPYFYIGEVKQDGTIDSCECIALRYDGGFFKGGWNKKGVLKDPYIGEYEGSFIDGKPINFYSRPEFRRKGVYKKKDGTSEVFIAYSDKVRPQFVGGKDNKEKENRSKKRGSVVSMKREYITGEIEHVLHSWKRDLKYEEDNQRYIFKTESGKELRLPKRVSEGVDEKYGETGGLRKGEDRAKQLANLINAIENFVCSHTVSKFVAFGSYLQVKYKDVLIRKTLLKNVEDRVGVSAKELAEWLNDYHK